MGLHSLPVSCSAWGVYRLYGRVNGELECLHQGGPSSAPVPVVSPCPTHASTVGPPTLAGSFGSASCGVTASLLWVLVRAKFCLCPLRLESLVTLVLGKANVQILLPLRPDSLGIPSLFVGYPRVQNLHNSARTSLALLFSHLWVTHLAFLGFDIFVIAPLLPTHCSCLFVFQRGISLFGGFPRPLLDGCSIASCNFGLLKEEMSTHPSIPPSWTESLQTHSFLDYLYLILSKMDMAK